MHRACSLILLWAFASFAYGQEPAKATSQPQSPASAPVDLDGTARLIQKMNEFIIPSVHFKNATIEQALDFLRKKSHELDTSSAPTGNKGIKLILRQPAPPEEIRITLDLKDVPFSDALRYVAELDRFSERMS